MTTRNMGQKTNMDRPSDQGVLGHKIIKRQEPQHLQDALREFMNSHLAVKRTRFAQVALAWQQLLPAELLSNCSVNGLQAGRLKVVAKSPVHMFELRLCRAELIKQLAVLCPRVKIQSIDIVVG
jgi:hypothetical protein